MIKPNTRKKPVIGITTSWRFKGGRTFSTVSCPYVQSVLKAGGLPVLIPLCKDTSEAARYMDLIDGLLITGGDEDIHPCLYGENPIAQLQSILPERDTWEISLLEKALDQGKPVLGICRGAQVINVAKGGSLYQNMGAQIKDVLGHFPKETAMSRLWHKVKLEPGTKVFDMFGKPGIMTNSFHNQAIKKLAPGFKAAAYSEDGIIEAIESLKHDFLVGIQWHPEALTANYPEFIKIFSTLNDACLKKDK